MKTPKLSYYKRAYNKAVKQSTRSRIFNNAMLNLSFYDSQKFLKWHLSNLNIDSNLTT